MRGERRGERGSGRGSGRHLRRADPTYSEAVPYTPSSISTRALRFTGEPPGLGAAASSAAGGGTMAAAAASAAAARR